MEKTANELKQKCPICGTTLTNRSTRIQRQISVAQSRKQFYCRRCGFGTK